MNHNSISPSELEFIKQTDLFKDLSSEDIDALKDLLSVEQIASNQAIIQEGDKSDEFYLILEGAVCVMKWDSEHLSEVMLDKIAAGAIFGEMSLFDHFPRSASIVTLKPTKIVKFYPSKLVAHPQLYLKLLDKLVKGLLTRFRNSNAILAEKLNKSQNAETFSKSFNEFLLLEYLSLGLSMAICSFYFPDHIIIAWGVALIPAFLLMQYFKIPFKSLEFNLPDWKKSILLAFIYTAASLFIYLAIIYLLKELLHYPLEWYWRESSLTVNHTLAALFIAFSQEIIARGILQKSLRSLYEGAGRKNVLINSLLLFVLTLPYGLVTAVEIFFISFPMGLIFQREKNLLCVILVHFFLLFFYLVNN